MNIFPVVFLALCCCIGHFAQEVVYMNIFPANPDYPNKCYHKKLNVAIEEGAIIMDHRYCNKLQCSLGRFEYTFTVTACNYTTLVSPSCQKIDGDLSLEFPDCCSRIVCDSEPEYPIIDNGLES